MVSLKDFFNVLECSIGHTGNANAVEPLTRIRAWS